MSEKDAAVLDERRALAQEREALLEKQRAERPKLTRALDAAVAKAEKALAAFEEARAVVAAAELELAQADRSTETRVDQINRQLRSSAPPAIASFRAELEKRIDEQRVQPAIFEVHAVLAPGEAPIVVGSTYLVLRRWLERARAAQQQAEELALAALSEAELAERLAALDPGPVPGLDAAEPTAPELAPVLQRRLKDLQGRAPAA